MTFNEFQELALITWNYDPTNDMQIVNAALGIGDEIGEIIEELFVNKINLTAFSKECGDVLYYCAIMYHLIDSHHSIIESVNTNRTGDELFKASANIQGQVKKYIFHGHNLDIEFVTDQLDRIVELIDQLLNYYTCNMSNAMQLVVDKLSKRYPNGFKTKDSINRIN